METGQVLWIAGGVWMLLAAAVVHFMRNAALLSERLDRTEARARRAEAKAAQQAAEREEADCRLRFVLELHADQADQKSVSALN